MSENISAEEDRNFVIDNYSQNAAFTKRYAEKEGLSRETPLPKAPDTGFGFVPPIQRLLVNHLIPDMIPGSLLLFSDSSDSERRKHLYSFNYVRDPIFVCLYVYMPAVIYL